jgi:hypothetical protein
MTTDTEARLRAALQARAELIILEPAELPRLPPNPRRSRWAWALAAAAAAVILAVAGLGVVVRHHWNSEPPVRQPTTSKSVTPPPPAPNAIHPASCTARNAGSWHTTAVMAPDTPPGVITGELWLLGVDSHGNTLAIEQTNPNRILLLPVDGPAQTRDLYTAPTNVPGQGPARVGGGMLDGDWLVFSIITGGGQGGLSGIETINTVTGTTRTVRDVALGNGLIVSEPIIVDGVIYWSEHTNFGTGHIYAYDPTTGTRHTLETGPSTDPFTVAGGVYWIGPAPKQVHTYRPGTLPPGYDLQAARGLNPPVLAGDHLLAWNQGGQIFVHKGAEPAIPVVAGSPIAISDDYLIYTHGPHGMSVLDLRTGATIALLEPGPFGLPAAGAASTLAFNTLSSHGGSNLAIAHVATLPRLHC